MQAKLVTISAFLFLSLAATISAQGASTPSWWALRSTPRAPCSAR